MFIPLAPENNRLLRFVVDVVSNSSKDCKREFIFFATNFLTCEVTKKNFVLQYQNQIFTDYNFVYKDRQQSWSSKQQIFMKCNFFTNFHEFLQIFMIFYKYKRKRSFFPLMSSIKNLYRSHLMQIGPGLVVTAESKDLKVQGLIPVRVQIIAVTICDMDVVGQLHNQLVLEAYYYMSDRDNKCHAIRA